MVSRYPRLMIGLLAVASATTAWTASPLQTVSLTNRALRLTFDLSTGTYSLVDLTSSAVALRGAHSEVGGASSSDPQFTRYGTCQGFKDELGPGQKMTVECRQKNGPDLLLEFRMYTGRSFVTLRAGLKNDTKDNIQLKQLKPMAGGQVFPEGGNWTDFRTLNAPSGMHQTQVGREPYCRSANNLLLTFRQNGKRRSIVLGGLKTEEFVKYAGFLPEGGSAAVRRETLAKVWPQGRLVSYFDCGDDSVPDPSTGPVLSVVQGTPFTWQPVLGEPMFNSVVFHEQQTVLQAKHIDPSKHYVLGWSWWDFDANGRVESVKVTGSDGLTKCLEDRHPLPQYWRKNEGPEEMAAPIPPDMYRDGQVLVAFTNESGVPNAVVSEVWLWEVPPSESVADDWARGRPVVGPKSDLRARAELEACDPVGKRLTPGTRYLPADSFYVDFVTANPFESLEQYGWQLRLANHARPNPYDFPTVCAWYTGVWNTAGAQNHPGKSRYRINTTPGVVEEMEKARDSGFLKYSRAAVRLVPDNYTENNPQGWWDDEHWQQHGLYVAPYETSRKWVQAVRERGGLAFTYFQANLLSKDFRTSHPGLLLGEDVTRTLDYTKPATQAYMRDVYGAMRGAISGMMFDYCDDLWARESCGGGFHDPSVTATSFYRTWLRLAKEGLGPDSWIHERALGNPPSDLALGIADSQRTSGDTNRIDPAMVSRSGLRWYKNRVVLAYDMDSKELYEAWKVPSYRGTDVDGRRMTLTMAYVAASRLLLANSFRDMTPEVLHDLSRTFPYHRQPRSARPIDAFVTEGWPRVYDFPVNQRWHQLTLFNSTEPSREETIEVSLSEDADHVGLGLNSQRDYYVYDFWNDRLVGRFPGRDKLDQRLRPGEARMISIHEAELHPQFLSTNRHIMQGYVDMVRLPRWDPERLSLTGASNVVGGETYRVVLALNGFEPKEATEGCHLEEIDNNLCALNIEQKEDLVVNWTVTFFPRRGKQT